MHDCFSRFRSSHIERGKVKADVVNMRCSAESHCDSRRACRPKGSFSDMMFAPLGEAAHLQFRSPKYTSTLQHGIWAAASTAHNARRHPTELEERLQTEVIRSGHSGARKKRDKPQCDCGYMNMCIPTAPWVAPYPAPPPRTCVTVCWRHRTPGTRYACHASRAQLELRIEPTPSSPHELHHLVTQTGLARHNADGRRARCTSSVRVRTRPARSSHRVPSVRVSGTRTRAHTPCTGACLCRACTICFLLAARTRAVVICSTDRTGLSGRLERRSLSARWSCSRRYEGHKGRQ